MSKKITLQPLAQRYPNIEGVEAPSKYKPPFEVSEDEFLRDYADSAEAGPVSFSPDCISDPEQVTQYSYPMKGRVIIR